MARLLAPDAGQEGMQKPDAAQAAPQALLQPMAAAQSEEHTKAAAELMRRKFTLLATYQGREEMGDYNAELRALVQREGGSRFKAADFADALTRVVRTNFSYPPVGEIPAETLAQYEQAYRQAGFTIPEDEAGRKAALAEILGERGRNYQAAADSIAADARRVVESIQRLEDAAKAAAAEASSQIKTPPRMVSSGQQVSMRRSDQEFYSAGLATPAAPPKPERQKGHPNEKQREQMRLLHVMLVGDFGASMESFPPRVTSETDFVEFLKSHAREIRSKCPDAKALERELKAVARRTKCFNPMMLQTWGEEAVANHLSTDLKSTNLKKAAIEAKFLKDREKNPHRIIEGCDRYVQARFEKIVPELVLTLEVAGLYKRG